MDNQAEDTGRIYRLLAGGERQPDMLTRDEIRELEALGFCPGANGVEVRKGKSKIHGALWQEEGGERWYFDDWNAKTSAPHSPYFEDVLTLARWVLVELANGL